MKTEMHSSLKIAIAFWIKFESKLSFPIKLNLTKHLQNLDVYQTEDARWFAVSLIERYSLNIEPETANAQINLFRQEIETALENRIQFCLIGDSNYPSELERIDNPPLVLSYLGELDRTLKKSRLGVVGSREPSQANQNWLDENLCPFLKITKSTVVSGGARGVDSKAHLAALKCESPAIIVLPSGLLDPYPPLMRQTMDFMVKEGVAFVSEYLPFQKMQKYHFVNRNRIIAGLSDFVLIVEASLRSGTMITAQAACDQGKPLLVLPSHPLDSKSRGGLDLIFEGATMIRDFNDLIQIFESEKSRFIGSQMHLIHN